MLGSISLSARSLDPSLTIAVEVTEKTRGRSELTVWQKRYILRDQNLAAEAANPMLPERKDRTRFRRSETWLMAGLLLGGVIVGVSCAIYWRSHGELSRIFVTGTVTLVAGALLGGIVSLLIADFDRRRVQRAAQLEYISNVLGQLKTVCDCVDKGRTLIAAHQSAKTYGEQMREFIDARVKLLAVDRALRFDDRRQPIASVIENVRGMESYLNSLTDEFIEHYKNISRSQSIYEAKMKEAVTQKDATLTTLPENTPWRDLEGLPRLTDFLQPLEDGQYTRELIGGSLTEGRPQESGYSLQFLGQLDVASTRLRKALDSELN